MPPIDVRPVTPADSQLLGDLFESLAGDSSADFFRPHPLTRTEAERVVGTLANGKDIYFVATDGDKLLGYGMLRGWNEGYAVPSFGVAVAPGQRGRGVGRQLLRWAIEASRARGSEQIMLKVYPDNLGARRLYESEGFIFNELAEDGVQLKGVLQLCPPR